LTGVFLDPPYADTAKRCDDIYACDSLSVAHKVREWAIINGDNKLMRIALCGYEGEHQMPDSWECVAWKAHGGYGGDTITQNSAKERIWFSPYCLKPTQKGLFDDLD
jgi:16S rRNA G966 N2-methylase RsmD